MWRETPLSPLHREGKIRKLLILLILLLFGASILVKIGGNIWIRRHLRDVKRSSDYSTPYFFLPSHCHLRAPVPIDDLQGYLGYDYPETWPIERGDALMAFDNPKRYPLDTFDGATEWASLVPKSGLIYLGPHHQPYSISMFHQLRCLDVVRGETVREANDTTKPTPLARHCLNYLRQMVMCRGDLELESFQFASNKNPIDLRGVYECKDWEAVYTEVKRNQEEHDNWLRRH
ncbi:hypothetical protein P691DRAFT_811350 [Macrolepiota fuliginosa MF-IS2]|uniref:Uncharacterized protein n=1 Tax=Macrolepiota fuliginosa MF-IS2 TaxID=1400762 RepID=A0A9P5XFF9_9AGAR|nr:hypothetical protein P691DRAFT_811350 [Macrolepiota fuliginosa MF-IS2]